MSIQPSDLQDATEKISLTTHLTRKQLGEILGVCLSEVDKIKNEIGYFKLSKSVRFSQEDVSRWLEKCKKGGPL